MMDKYFDLIAHIARQQAWSRMTFGPPCERGYEGVLDHIRKEIGEIEADPYDLEEWVDVITLALDGAWRIGHTPEEIAFALDAKLRKNRDRSWPDWRNQTPGKAIEHIEPCDEVATPSR